MSFCHFLTISDTYCRVLTEAFAIPLNDLDVFQLQGTSS